MPISVMNTSVHKEEAPLTVGSAATGIRPTSGPMRALSGFPAFFSGRTRGRWICIRRSSVDGTIYRIGAAALHRRHNRRPQPNRITLYQRDRHFQRN
eukprot:1321006-Pyramimonas_sp.AAC.1